MRYLVVLSSGILVSQTFLGKGFRVIKALRKGKIDYERPNILSEINWPKLHHSQGLKVGGNSDRNVIWDHLACNPLCVRSYKIFTLSHEIFYFLNFRVLENLRNISLLMFESREIKGRGLSKSSEELSSEVQGYRPIPGANNWSILGNRSFREKLGISRIEIEESKPNQKL